ncbi:MAG TPA: DUF4389 domain-containing protein [Actinomycetes bacterium]
MTTSGAYPLRVEASLDRPLSRWLWLVKWLLAIPHFIVLFFLWVAYFVLSVGAFFAILFTGRYPRPIFDFNVGVLRWSWRVAYYAYGALGTDRYPPFTLADVPDYPTHLQVDYPEHLSRGLVLVKWWLLAIPHYIVVGIFLGGGAWVAWGADDRQWNGGGGLIGILVLVAAVVLTVTGRYPQPIYDFVLGLNRWVLRVAAYAGLMTDDYPPFRLDLGEHEPTGTLTVPPLGGPPAAGPEGTAGGPVASSGPAAPSGPETAGGPVAPSGPETVSGPQAPSGPGTGGKWTAGRIVSLVVGAVLGLASLGVLFGGVAALWADQTQREDGFVTSGDETYSTGGAALATDRISIDAGPGWDVPHALLGDVRVRVTSADPGQAVFVGIAPADEVGAYLLGVRYTTLRDLSNDRGRTEHQGARSASAPAQVGIWSASASGTGTQSLVWAAEEGDWAIVAMNADGSPGLTVTADIGAEVPALPWVAAGLLIGGVVMLVLGVVLIVVPTVRASR